LFEDCHRLFVQTVTQSILHVLLLLGVQRCLFYTENQDYLRELTSCVRQTNQPRWCLENGPSKIEGK